MRERERERGTPSLGDTHTALIASPSFLLGIAGLRWVGICGFDGEGRLHDFGVRPGTCSDTF